MDAQFKVNDGVPGIVAIMQRMFTEGSDANFAVFDADSQKSYFFQIVAYPGATQLYAEVVGDDNANPPHGYDSTQKARLASRTWQPQRGNLVKQWTVVGPGDYAGIAYELMYVVTEVFMCPPDHLIQVELNIE